MRTDSAAATNLEPDHTDPDAHRVDRVEERHELVDQPDRAERVGQLGQRVDDGQAQAEQRHGLVDAVGGGVPDAGGRPAVAQDESPHDRQPDQENDRNPTVAAMMWTLR